MNIQDQVNLQQFKVLKQIMVASLLLAENQDYYFPIGKPLTDTDLSEDHQRLLIRSLEEKGVIAIVGRSYRDNSVSANLIRAIIHDGPPPIAYGIKIIEPSFSEMYDEFERKCEMIGLEDERWSVFKQGNFQISYRLGCCYVNGYKEPFIKMQTGMAPRKIWEYAFENKKLHISSQELLSLFKKKTSIDVSESICKTYRGYFLKNLEKFCKENAISLPDGMPERWLRLVNGELRIFE